MCFTGAGIGCGLGVACGEGVCTNVGLGECIGCGEEVAADGLCVIRVWCCPKSGTDAREMGLCDGPL